MLQKFSMRVTMWFLNHLVSSMKATFGWLIIKINDFSLKLPLLFPSFVAVVGANPSNRT